MFDFVKTPKIARFFFKNLVFFIPQPTRIKKVYLTFDDGPNPETTPFILNTLKRFEAKGTFFLLGKNAKAYPDLVKQILMEGHQIGNHTYNHLNGWKTNNQEYFQDIEKAKIEIASTLFRPPYGKIKISQAKQLSKSYKVIMWHLSAQDYRPDFIGKKCLESLKKNTKSGSIIVFHDSVKAFDNLKMVLHEYLTFLHFNQFKLEIIDFKAINH